MPICVLVCITVVYVYLSQNINHLFRKSVKDVSVCFTLFLSVRENKIGSIGYNYLETIGHYTLKGIRLHNIFQIRVFWQVRQMKILSVLGRYFH